MTPIIGLICVILYFFNISIPEKNVLLLVVKIKNPIFASELVRVEGRGRAVPFFHYYKLYI